MYAPRCIYLVLDCTTQICRHKHTHTYHGPWWASGSRWSLLSWWPLCRNNIQSHVGYNTLGTSFMQCISVMTSHWFQPWVCLLMIIFICNRSILLADSSGKNTWQYFCPRWAKWEITCNIQVSGPSVGFDQAWRQILPVLRLVRRGPEVHVAQENPGKKTDTLN